MVERRKVMLDWDNEPLENIKIVLGDYGEETMPEMMRAAK